MKRAFYFLRNPLCGTTLVFCLGLLVLVCSCTSQKASNVGTAAGKGAAIGGASATAAGAAGGATAAAISGGKVLQGAGTGAAVGGAAGVAGGAAGAAVHELLK
ncbi:MAG: hypothetical protein ACE5IC_09445 [Candidatus Brocadiales bacterium]